MTTEVFLLKVGETVALNVTVNIYLITAAILTVVLVLVHSILGEIKIFRHMNDQGLPVVRGVPFLFHVDSAARRTLRFVWHIPSILCLGIACILFCFGTNPPSGSREEFIILCIGVSMLVSGLVTMLFTKGGHMGWFVFLMIGACCFLGVL